MARPINWEKARRRQLVWERGGIPVWQDGWAPFRSERSVTRATPATIQDQFLLPGPYTLRLEVEAERPIILRYRFLSLHPEHRRSLPALVERLIHDSPLPFLFCFDDFIQFDYSFHNMQIVDSIERYETSREVRPRKNRHKIPPHMRVL